MDHAFSFNERLISFSLRSMHLNNECCITALKSYRRGGGRQPHISRQLWGFVRGENTLLLCQSLYSLLISFWENRRKSEWNGERWTTWPAWFNELLEIARCKKLQYVYITMCGLTQFSIMTVDPECIVASYEVSQVTHFMFQALFPLLSSLSMRSSSLHSQLISTLNTFSSFLGTLQAIADSATRSGWCF